MLSVRLGAIACAAMLATSAVAMNAVAMNAVAVSPLVAQQIPDRAFRPLVPRPASRRLPRRAVA